VSVDLRVMTVVNYKCKEIFRDLEIKNKFLNPKSMDARMNPAYSKPVIQSILAHE